MGRGSGRSKPTLGDAASDFMAQWKASRPGDALAVVETGPAIEGNRGKDGEQTFRSWKRGGAEVKVKKGVSTGYQKRRQETGKPSVAKPPPEVAAKAGPSSTLPIPRMAPTSLPAPPPPALVKSLRQRLSEASADLRRLKICAAMSRPRDCLELSPVVEDKAGRLAILGLDFGTAFTKAVVRWSQRHYAVDWSDAVEGEDHDLLASVFSEAPDGCCILGTHQAIPVSELGCRGIQHGD